MTETISTPTSYADVARLRGQEVLLYTEFGSYQGEWLLFAFGKTEDGYHGYEPGDGFYYLYKGWYGSCSGCDDIQGRWGYDRSNISKKDVDEFLAEYPHFAEIPRDTARNLAINATLKTITPANDREYYGSGGEDWQERVEWVREAEFIIKVRENVPLTPQEILASRNQESRRAAIERDGIEAFMKAVNAEVLETDARGDRLVSITFNDTVSRYLWLKDGSTDREYVLRVPDNTRSVLSGKAWSFGVEPREYKPLIET